MQSLQNNNHRDNPPAFSLLCWNILARVFTKAQYFPYTKQECLDYEYRIKIVKQLIRERRFDILCLQEVDKNLDFFKFLDSQHYSYHFRQTKHQGILIAWKQSFQELEWIQIDYDKLENYDQDKKIYMTDHGCLIVKLRQVATNKQLMVANTHLFWNPHYQKVKFHQISEALRHLKAYAGNMPMILSGDFNSQPQSHVVRLIESANVQNCNKEMQTKYNFVKEQLPKLKSVFDINDGRYTNYTVNFKGTLDYVFYNQQAIAVFKKQKYMSEEQMKKQVALPNSTCPSDHIPLICSLYIK